MKFKILLIFALIFSSWPLCAMDHPTELDAELAEAAQTGNSKKVESCLLRGANPNTTTLLYDNWGEPKMIIPLIIASKKGFTKIVKLLLDHHANVDARDHWGQTALMYASRSGQTKTAKQLLDHGAIIDTQNTAGSTALMHAAESGQTKIIKLLLDHHTNVNLQDMHHRTALHWATSSNQSMSVNILLKHRANINIMDEYGHIALSGARIKTLEPLLKYINHILDKTDDPETFHVWDQYILDALSNIETRGWTFPIKTINAFRMLLHHASKLPLSKKKLESVTAKRLGHHDYGESSFRKSVKHLRKHAF